MLKSGEKLQKLLKLMITWALLLVCFVAYQQYFVKHQESFFKQRGFRSLSKLSSELGFKFEQAQVSTESFLKLAAAHNHDNVAGGYLDLYLKDVLPGGQAKDNALEAAQQCTSNYPAIESTPQNGIPLKSIQDHDGLTLSIYCFSDLAHEDQSNLDHSETKLIYTLDLQPRIRSGFQQQGNDFDDVLVADSRGRVVLQESSIGPRIASLKSAVTENNDNGPQPKEAQPQKANQPVSSADGESAAGEERDLEKLNDTSVFTDVTLAGETYKMFSQPVRISLRNPVQGKPPLKLVIAGLRRSSSFASETHALPYSTLIWVGLIVMALFSLSWPLFKLHYMSNSERFTPKDGWFLVITIFLASTSATLIFLNASYISQAKRETDNHLKALATRIQTNFSTEMDLVRQQLDQLRDGAIQQAAKAVPQRILIPNYLRDASAAASLYPYFEIAFWADCNGIQRLKFDVRQAPTPVTDVHNQPFFRGLESARALVSEPDPGNAKQRVCPKILEEDLKAPKFTYFQALNSPNTDEFSALLATPFPSDSQAPDFAMQVMTTRPMSLIDPVLPPGYRFAVIDKDCNVLFHSDSFRDGKENFCEESESKKELDPWLFSGTDSWLDISYAGHSERAYLTALKLPGASPGRAFLIVFQEPDRQVTLNLAVILVCSLLLAAYSAIPLCLAGLHLALRRPWGLFYAPLFVWPCRRHAFTYIQIAAATGGMLLMFWLAYSRLYEVPLLTLTLAVPLLAIVFAISKIYGLRKVLALLALVLLAAGGLGLALFWFPGSKPWRWVFAFLVFSAGIAYLLSGSAARVQSFASRFFGRRARDSAQSSFTVLYVVAALSIITAAGVVPTVGFFKYAYDTASELVLKRDQVVMSERVLERSKRIRDYYNTALQPTAVQAPPKIMTDRLAADLDRYDRYDQETFIETCDPALICSTIPAKAQEATDIGFNEHIEKMIAGATLLFPANQLGSEMSKLGVAGDNFTDEKRSWEHHWNENPDNPREFTLVWEPTTRMPNFQVKSIYPRWPGLTAEAKGSLVFLWLILGVWLAKVVKKIFLTKFEGELAHEEVDWRRVADIKKSYLIIGQAKTGKTKWLRDILSTPAAAAAAAGATGASVAAIAPAGDSGPAEWWDLRSSKNDMACPKQPSLLVLDHFEFNLRDPKCNLERLQLLESRLYDSECKVVVVSTVDPLFCLTEGAAEMLSGKDDPSAARRLLERWARVLSKLTRVRLKDSGQAEFQNTVQTFKTNHASCDESQSCRRLGEWVSQECRPTTMLQQIGAEILGGFKEGELVTHEWLVRNILERADLYYHVLWSGMTASERLALYQLALDGWANPKNLAALQQLERKSLILRSPMYQTMNESFRRFVESAEHADEIEQWEKNERQSTWHAFRLVAIAVAVGAVVWLVYTQSALSQAVTGYVAGIATLLTAVTSLFGRSGRTDSPKAEANKEA